MTTSEEAANIPVPMEAIYQAFDLLLRAAQGEHVTIMRVPADPQRDADLVLLGALEELERRRNEEQTR